MKIAIITAGGAGMFCGSCMQDNTLARALRMAGADALLLPTYTPIRVDEENVSSSRVFLGGLNVYLDSKMPGWRLLPRAMKRWLDRPGLVNFLSRLSSTDASHLGPLTIDLLKGTHGPQRAEIEELIRFLCDELRPDVILFSNALLSGVVPELRRQFSGRIGCLLQGDDVFLNGLPEPWRSQALELVSRNAAHFDRLLTHSDYYAEFMQRYLALPAGRFRTIPLTIEDQPSRIATPETAGSDSTLTVGYFARICPEKGAFRFLDAAERILPSRTEMRMVMAGYLPQRHRREFERRLIRIRSATAERLIWAGSPSERNEKFQLIQSFDWLCVPSEYREPKGLYVLEAALAGVPSLVPAHGAFPERIAALGSGMLFDPKKTGSLDAMLCELQATTGQRAHLRDACLNLHGMEQTGRQVLDVLQQL